MDQTPIFYADLKHWNHHIFTFKFPKKLSSLPSGKLWFDLNKDGKLSDYEKTRGKAIEKAMVKETLDDEVFAMAEKMVEMMYWK